MRIPHCREPAASLVVVVFVAFVAAVTGAVPIPLRDDVHAGPAATDLTDKSGNGAPQSARAMKARRLKEKPRQAAPAGGGGDREAAGGGGGGGGTGGAAGVAGGAAAGVGAGGGGAGGGVGGGGGPGGAGVGRDDMGGGGKGGGGGGGGGQAEAPFQQLSETCATIACKESGQPNCPTAPPGFVTTKELCDQFKNLLSQAQKTKGIDEVDYSDKSANPPSSGAEDMDAAMEDVNARGIRAFSEEKILPLVRKLIDMVLDSYFGAAPTDSK